MLFVFSFFFKFNISISTLHVYRIYVGGNALRSTHANKLCTKERERENCGSAKLSCNLYADKKVANGIIKIKILLLATSWHELQKKNVKIECELFPS